MTRIMKIDEMFSKQETTYENTTPEEVKAFFTNSEDYAQFSDFIEFAENEYGFVINIALLRSPSECIRLIGDKEEDEYGNEGEFVIYIKKGKPLSISKLLYDYEEQDEDNLYPVVDEMADVFKATYEK